MTKRLANACIAGLIIGLLIGLPMTGGDALGILFVCGLGGILAFGSSCVLSILNRWFPIYSTTTDVPALYGAAIGAMVGAVIGPWVHLGRYLIEQLNPSLPEMDFGLPLGILGGVIAGSFVGSLTFSLAGKAGTKRSKDLKNTINPNL